MAAWLCRARPAPARRHKRHMLLVSGRAECSYKLIQQDSDSQIIDAVKIHIKCRKKHDSKWRRIAGVELSVRSHPQSRFQARCLRLEVQCHALVHPIPQDQKDARDHVCTLATSLPGQTAEVDQVAQVTVQIQLCGAVVLCQWLHQHSKRTCRKRSTHMRARVYEAALPPNVTFPWTWSVVCGLITDAHLLTWS